MKEIIFVVLLASGMLGTSAFAGQWWLFSVFAVFFTCFGVIEFLAVKKTGKSVSQKFWDYGKSHPVGKWVILGGMLIAWLALLFHLAGCASKKPDVYELMFSDKAKQRFEKVNLKCCVNNICDMQCMMDENKRLLNE